MLPDPVLETQGLCRRFGGQMALDQVTLRVARGGVHAIVGRNGAGKSTLYRLLLGFLTPTSGASRVLGTDSAALTPSLRGRIGFVAEPHPLPGWMSATSLKEMHRRLHPGWNEATFREVAGTFRLRADRPVRRLSHGERAGLALALALAPGPELVLLDEPTLGLDVVANRAFLESVLFAGDRELRTVVFSSHQMAEVERLADRLIVLDQGRVIAESTPDELRARVTGWSVDDWPATLLPESVPGLLQTRSIDGQTHLLVLDQDAVALASCLAERGARGIASLPVGFERAVDAFLSRPEPGRQGAL